MSTMLVLSLLALAFSTSLWAAWRMRWERDRALDALADVRALLFTHAPQVLDDARARGILARTDAVLRGESGVG